jgi:hypothetical protein
VLVLACDVPRVSGAEHHGVDVDTWTDVAAIDAKGPAVTAACVAR